MCEEDRIKPYFLNEAANGLLEYAEDQFERGGQEVHICDNNPELEQLLSPLGDYPHAFVLACIMDIQEKANNAWTIPLEVKRINKNFDMDSLSKLSLKDIEDIFGNMEHGHRFSTKKANRFYLAIQKIHDDYNDDAKKIWVDTPPSGLVVSRFLEFEGVGLKIATMATNILVRQYKIPLKDKHCIDISPDTHTVCVFQRLGLISDDTEQTKEKDKKAKEKAMYMARIINPVYPGILDYPCWFVGDQFCKAKGQQCINEKGTCPFFVFCPSKKENK